MNNSNNNKKQIWILVPMCSDESKREFESFIKLKTGRDYKVPTQYKSGLVMLLVSPDLNHFNMTNITCGNSADIKTQGVMDFIDRYEEIKKQALKKK